MSPEKHDQDIHLRVASSDLADWKRIAETERMTLSDWIRRTLYEAARYHDIGSKVVARRTKKAKP